MCFSRIRQISVLYLHLQVSKSVLNPRNAALFEAHLGCHVHIPRTEGYRMFDNKGKGKLVRIGGDSILIAGSQREFQMTKSGGQQ